MRSSFRRIKSEFETWILFCSKSDSIAPHIIVYSEPVYDYNITERQSDREIGRLREYGSCLNGFDLRMRIQSENMDPIGMNLDLSANECESG